MTEPTPPARGTTDDDCLACERCRAELPVPESR
jgi:hypothetical protein